MKIKRNAVVRVLLGVALVVYGSFEWSRRLTYQPDVGKLIGSGIELTDFSNPDTAQLIAACRGVEQSNGWLLLVIRTNLVADQIFRGYFESAPDERGLYVEYDPFEVSTGPSFRLGISSQVQNTLVHLRTVRRDEDAFVALGIQSDQIRVVTNGVDRIEQYVESFQPSLSCDSPVVGLADEIDCKGCDISVRYAAGSDQLQLTEALNSLSNARSYNVRRVLGTVATFIGSFLVLFPIPSLRSCRKKIL